MSKPIEKGAYVLNESHLEYGVGRVLAVEVFATRVIFPQGGLRVFRAENTMRLKVVSTPGPAELAVLDQKEANLVRGVVDAPRPKAVEEPVAKKAAKPRKKAAS